MAPAHIPAFLFATLIASFSYVIAVTLFIESIGTILRKRRATGKINLPFVLPSILIFILATVNVIGLWINIHAAFVVNAADTGLPWPHQNARKDGHSDRPSRGHYFGRCFDGLPYICCMEQ